MALMDYRPTTIQELFMSNECLTLHTNQFFLNTTCNKKKQIIVSVMSNLRYDGQVGKRPKTVK